MERMLAGDSDAGRAGKLKMLDPESRSLLLDELIMKAQETRVTEVLMQVALSALTSSEERDAIIARTARRVAMFGNVYSKIAFLERVTTEDFSSLPDEVRGAFFEDVVANVEADQYEVVNKLVPQLVHHVASVPSALHEQFVLALLDQARSSSWHGAPAAQRMLQTLPPDMAIAGLRKIEIRYLCLYGHRDEVKSFVTLYGHLADKHLKPVIEDYLGSSRRQFLEKYQPDEF